MSYRLEWHPQAFKVLKKLPKDTIERVTNKFDQVVENPFHHLQHFEGVDLYKLRIGDYRALIKVNYKDKILLVQVFDHRSKVYRK